MTAETTLPLRDRQGSLRGSLTLACLRNGETWRGLDAMVDRRLDNTLTSAAAPVQLLEEMSYAYSLTTDESLVVDRIEPTDLFSSTADITTGRLDVRRATGTLTIDAVFIDGTSASCDVEVRSRKLDYESEYRSMLLRIAREASELVQAAFAPSALSAFRPNTSDDPHTTYQRFAFIQALLQSDEVQDALRLIQRRPHFEHVDVEWSIDPARGIRASASVAKQLALPGPRQSTHRPVGGLMTIPRVLVENTNELSYDTVPNRFVKYVLTRWRSIAVDVERALQGETPSERRGRREAHLTASELDQVLATEALADAGRLTVFPHSNQVLQARAGYREILEGFLLAEAAATIDWEDRHRLFAAGQRNVAELYEYWVFLELVRIVESLPGFEVDRRGLLKETASGLSLELRRTGEAVVTGRATRRGTPVVVRVWFNKSFGRARDASWTVPMRPDCSIHIEPLDRALKADTWVHFDAKYRIHELSDTFDDPVSDALPRGQAPINADLAKMHAYRDAIRRTAGAYVLYPGSDDARAVRHTAYHEIVPGLGAFALRPTTDGQASSESTRAIAAFLGEVIDHVSAQGTSSERARYWTDTSYMPRSNLRMDFERRLLKPPADTTVLLGFVKSVAHLEWVMQTSEYNLRADADRVGSVAVDAPELAPDFVLLYGRDGEEGVLFRAEGQVSVRSSDELRASGYPEPRGARYFCISVSDAERLTRLGGAIARRLAGRDRAPGLRSAPRIVTWAQLSSASRDDPRAQDRFPPGV